MTASLLPDTFILRASRWDDAQAIVDMINAIMVADGDSALSVSLADLLNEWNASHFDPETDSWVVTLKENGRIVGYVELLNRHSHAMLRADGYVDNDFTGNGIGRALLTKVDERARQHLELADPGLRVYIQSGIAATDTTASELHTIMGYKPVRYFYRMEVTLKDAPIPELPVGLELRHFDSERDLNTVYETVQAAFADHWGYVRSEFEQWRHHMIEEEFDPTLWHLAWDGDELAGVALCRWRSDIGWVRQLGVRRAWRKRGLGMALLQQSFADFYTRGMPTIGLGVDASSPTGATRLYERAGMHVANQYITFEKELRSGIELSEE